MKIYSANKSGEDAFVRPFRSFVKGINHRGYAPDGSGAPENTIPAFQLSAKMGFRYVETDVAYTSDKVPVLLHDKAVDRTSNGTGNINEMTFAEARQLDFGSWKSSAYAGTKIPTLEEFLCCCRNLGLHPYIELKYDRGYTVNDLQPIVDLVEAYGLRNKVSYISFELTLLAKIKQLDPYARLGKVASTLNTTQIDNAVSLRTDTNEVFISAGTVSAQAIADCKDAHLPLERWTINDKSSILAFDDYISGVTSDNVNAEFVLYEKSL